MARYCRKNNRLIELTLLLWRLKQRGLEPLGGKVSLIVGQSRHQSQLVSRDFPDFDVAVPVGVRVATGNGR
jgi:hypothetical protein